MNAGNDRVQRALARSEHVRMVGLQREQRAAVVQHEAGSRRHDAAAEARIQALNQRDDVAVLVDGGQVDRVAAARVGQAVERDGLHVARGACAGSIRRARSFARSLLSMRRHRHRREPRIRHVAQHVGIRELLRLDHHVQGARAVQAVLRRAGTAPSGSASSAPRSPRCSAAAPTRSSRGRSSKSDRPTRAGTAAGLRRSSCRRADARRRGWRRRSFRRRSRPRLFPATSRSDAASSGFRNISPAFGARPLTRYSFAACSSAASFAADPAHPCAMMSVTGKPLAA